MQHSLCPVCNGLTTLFSYCKTCKGTLTDHGRYTDFFGDYSPYRPIDDLKMTDGLMDNQTCPHQVSCESCGFKGVKLIDQI